MFLLDWEFMVLEIVFSDSIFVLLYIAVYIYVTHSLTQLALFCSIRCHYQISQLNPCRLWRNAKKRNEQHNKTPTDVNCLSWMLCFALYCIVYVYVCVVTVFNLFELHGIKGISGVCIQIKYRSLFSFLFITLSFLHTVS